MEDMIEARNRLPTLSTCSNIFRLFDHANLTPMVCDGVLLQIEQILGLRLSV